MYASLFQFNWIADAEWNFDTQVGRDNLFCLTNSYTTTPKQQFDFEYVKNQNPSFLWDVIICHVPWNGTNYPVLTIFQNFHRLIPISNILFLYFRLIKKSVYITSVIRIKKLYLQIRFWNYCCASALTTIVIRLTNYSDLSCWWINLRIIWFFEKKLNYSRIIR